MQDWACYKQTTCNQPLRQTYRTSKQAADGQTGPHTKRLNCRYATPLGKRSGWGVHANMHLASEALSQRATASAATPGDAKATGANIGLELEERLEPKHNHHSRTHETLQANQNKRNGEADDGLGLVHMAMLRHPPTWTLHSTHCRTLHAHASAAGHSEEAEARPQGRLPCRPSILAPRIRAATGPHGAKQARSPSHELGVISRVFVRRGARTFKRPEAVTNSPLAKHRQHALQGGLHDQALEAQRLRVTR